MIFNYNETTESIRIKEKPSVLKINQRKMKNQG